MVSGGGPGRGDRSAPHRLEVRAATIEDAGLLAEMGERTFRAAFGAENDEADLDLYLATSFGPEIQLRELLEPATVYLLATDDDGPAGFLRLRLDTSPPVSIPGGRIAEVVRIYAENERIGNGVGSALMTAALGVVREHGCDAVWLSVWERNARGIRFYEKWGFEVVGRTTFVVGEDVQDDLVMALLVFGSDSPNLP